MAATAHMTATIDILANDSQLQTVKGDLKELLGTIETIKNQGKLLIGVDSSQVTKAEAMVKKLQQTKNSTLYNVPDEHIGVVPRDVYDIARYIPDVDERISEAKRLTQAKRDAVNTKLLGESWKEYIKSGLTDDIFEEPTKQNNADGIQAEQWQTYLADILSRTLKVKKIEDEGKAKDSQNYKNHSATIQEHLAGLMATINEVERMTGFDDAQLAQVFGGIEDFEQATSAMQYLREHFVNFYEAKLSSEQGIQSAYKNLKGKGIDSSAVFRAVNKFVSDSSQYEEQQNNVQAIYDETRKKYNIPRSGGGSGSGDGDDNGLAGDGQKITIDSSEIAEAEEKLSSLKATLKEVKEILQDFKISIDSQDVETAETKLKNLQEAFDKIKNSNVEADTLADKLQSDLNDEKAVDVDNVDIPDLNKVSSKLEEIKQNLSDLQLNIDTSKAETSISQISDKIEKLSSFLNGSGNLTANKNANEGVLKYLNYDTSSVSSFKRSGNDYSDINKFLYSLFNKSFNLDEGYAEEFLKDEIRKIRQDSSWGAILKNKTQSGGISDYGLHDLSVLLNDIGNVFHDGFHVDQGIRLGRIDPNESFNFRNLWNNAEELNNALKFAYSFFSDLSTQLDVFSVEELNGLADNPIVDDFRSVQAHRQNVLQGVDRNHWQEQVKNKGLDDNYISQAFSSSLKRYLEYAQSETGKKELSKADSEIDQLFEFAKLFDISALDALDENGTPDQEDARAAFRKWLKSGVAPSKEMIARGQKLTLEDNFPKADVENIFKEIEDSTSSDTGGLAVNIDVEKAVQDIADLKAKAEELKTQLSDWELNIDTSKLETAFTDLTQKADTLKEKLDSLPNAQSNLEVKVPEETKSIIQNADEEDSLNKTTLIADLDTTQIEQQFTDLKNKIENQSIDVYIYANTTDIINEIDKIKQEIEKISGIKFDDIGGSIGEMLRSVLTEAKILKPSTGKRRKSGTALNNTGFLSGEQQEAAVTELTRAFKGSKYDASNIQVDPSGAAFMTVAWKNAQNSLVSYKAEIDDYRKLISSTGALEEDLVNKSTTRFLSRKQDTGGLTPEQAILNAANKTAGNFTVAEKDISVDKNGMVSFIAKVTEADGVVKTLKLNIQDLWSEINSAKSGDGSKIFTKRGGFAKNGFLNEGEVLDIDTSGSRQNILKEQLPALFEAVGTKDEQSLMEMVSAITKQMNLSGKKPENFEKELLAAVNVLKNSADEESASKTEAMKTAIQSILQTIGVKKKEQDQTILDIMNSMSKWFADSDAYKDLTPQADSIMANAEKIQKAIGEKDEKSLMEMVSVIAKNAEINGEKPENFEAELLKAITAIRNATDEDAGENRKKVTSAVEELLKSIGVRQSDQQASVVEMMDLMSNWFLESDTYKDLTPQADSIAADAGKMQKAIGDAGDNDKPIIQSINSVESLISSLVDLYKQGDNSEALKQALSELQNSLPKIVSSLKESENSSVDIKNILSGSVSELNSLLQADEGEDGDQKSVTEFVRQVKNILEKALTSENSESIPDMLNKALSEIIAIANSKLKTADETKNQVSNINSILDNSLGNQERLDTLDFVLQAQKQQIEDDKKRKDAEIKKAQEISAQQAEAKKNQLTAQQQLDLLTKARKKAFIDRFNKSDPNRFVDDMELSNDVFKMSANFVDEYGQITSVLLKTKDMLNLVDKEGNLKFSTIDDIDTSKVSMSTSNSNSKNRFGRVDFYKGITSYSKGNQAFTLDEKNPYNKYLPKVWDLTLSDGKTTKDYLYFFDKGLESLTEMQAITSKGLLSEDFINKGLLRSQFDEYEKSISNFWKDVAKSGEEVSDEQIKERLGELLKSAPEDYRTLAIRNALKKDNHLQSEGEFAARKEEKEQQKEAERNEKIIQQEMSNTQKLLDQSRRVRVKADKINADNVNPLSIDTLKTQLNRIVSVAPEELKTTLKPILELDPQIDKKQISEVVAKSLTDIQKNIDSVESDLTRANGEIKPTSKKDFDAQTNQLKAYREALQAINDVSIKGGSRFTLKDVFESSAGAATTDNIDQIIRQYQEAEGKIVKSINNIRESNGKIFADITTSSYGSNVYDKLTVQIENVADASEKAQVAISETVARSQESLTPGQQMLEIYKQKISQLFTYLSGMDIARYAYNAVKSGFTFTRELDSLMTIIQQTTDISGSSIQTLSQGAIQQAKDLGVQVSDVSGAIDVYASMGETAESLLSKSAPTTMMAKAAGMEITQASDVIQGVTQQFTEYQGSESSVVNTLEKISSNMKMNFGTGIQNMAEGIQNAGSIAKDSGMSFELLAASVGKLSEVTRQDGSQIGTALKTMMARVSRAKDADTDVTAEDRSDAAEALKKYAGIDVYNGSGQYKDLGQTLDELAGENGKWNKLNDAQQANVAEAFGGVRGVNNVRILLDNWKEIRELEKAALTDTNFYQEVQEKSMQSFESKIDTLSASGNDFFYNLLNTDFLKGGLTALTGIVDQFTRLTGLINKIPALTGAGYLGILLGGGALLGGWDEGFSKFNQKINQGQNASFLNEMKNSIFNSFRAIPTKGIQKSLQERFQNENNADLTWFKAFKAGANNSNLLTANLKDTNTLYGALNADGLKTIPQVLKEIASGSGTVTQKAGEMFKVLGSGVKTAWASMSSLSKVMLGATGIIAAIQIGSAAFDKLSVTWGEANEKVKSLNSAMSEQKEQAKSLKSFTESQSGTRLNELTQKMGGSAGLSLQELDEYHSLCNELAEVAPNLVAGFDSQNNAILNITASTRDLNAEYEKLALNMAKTRVSEAGDRLKPANQASGNKSWLDEAATRVEDFIRAFKGEALDVDDAAKLFDNLGGRLEMAKKLKEFQDNYLAGNDFSFDDINEVFSKSELDVLGELPNELFNKANRITNHDQLVEDFKQSIDAGKFTEVIDQLSASQQAAWSEVQQLLIDQLDIKTAEGTLNISDTTKQTVKNLIGKLSMETMPFKEGEDITAEMLGDYVEDMVNVLQRSPSIQDSLTKLLNFDLSGVSSSAELKKLLTMLNEVADALNMDVKPLSEALGLDQIDSIYSGMKSVEDLALKGYGSKPTNKEFWNDYLDEKQPAEVYVPKETLEAKQENEIRLGIDRMIDEANTFSSSYIKNMADTVKANFPKEYTQPDAYVPSDVRSQYKYQEDIVNNAVKQQAENMERLAAEQAAKEKAWRESIPDNAGEAKQKLIEDNQLENKITSSIAAYNKQLQDEERKLRYEEINRENELKKSREKAIADNQDLITPPEKPKKPLYMLNTAESGYIGASEEERKAVAKQYDAINKKYFAPKNQNVLMDGLQGGAFSELTNAQKSAVAALDANTRAVSKNTSETKDSNDLQEKFKKRAPDSSDVKDITGDKRFASNSETLKKLNEHGWQFKDAYTDGYYATAYSNDDGTRSVVMTPVLPDNTVLTPEQLQEYANQLLAGKQIEVDGITLGMWEGKDSVQQAKTFDKTLAHAAKNSMTHLDIMREISNLMRNLHIEDVNWDYIGQALNDAIHKGLSLEDFKADLLATLYDAEREQEKINELWSNTRAARESIDAMWSARSESNSTTGLSKATYDQLDKIFSGTKGYDRNKFFGLSAESGIHINEQAYKQVEKQWKTDQLKKYTSEVENLEYQYGRLCQKIAKAGGQATESQLQQRDAMKAQIDEAKAAQAEFEGLINPVTEFKRAGSETQVYDDYSYIQGKQKSMQELNDKHLYGNTEYQKYIETFSNPDIDFSKWTGQEYADAFAEAQRKSKRYMTEDLVTGVSNFVNDLIAGGEEYATGSMTEGFEINASAQDIARKLNISEAAVDQVFNALKGLGVPVEFTIDSPLKPLKDEAARLAKEVGHDLGDIEVDGKSYDEISAQIDKVTKKKEEAESQGMVDENELKAYEAELAYLNAALGELQQQAGLNFDFNIHDNSEEIQDNIKHLEEIGKGLDFELRLDTTNVEVAKTDLQNMEEYVKKNFTDPKTGRINFETDGAVEATNTLIALKNHVTELERPAILDVDVSGLNEADRAATESVQRIVTLVQELDQLEWNHSMGIDADEGSIEKCKSDIAGAINELVATGKGAEIVAALGLDVETDPAELAGQIFEKVQNLNIPDLSKLLKINFSTGEDGEMEINTTVERSQLDQTIADVEKGGTYHITTEVDGKATEPQGQEDKKANTKATAKSSTRSYGSGMTKGALGGNKSYGPAESRFYKVDNPLKGNSKFDLSARTQASTVKVDADTSGAVKETSAVAKYIESQNPEMSIDGNASNAESEAEGAANTVEGLNPFMRILADASAATGEGYSAMAIIGGLMPMLMILGNASGVLATAEGTKSTIDMMTALLQILGLGDNAQGVAQGIVDFVTGSSPTMNIIGNAQDANAKVNAAAQNASNRKPIMNIGGDNQNAIASGNFAFNAINGRRATISVVASGINAIIGQLNSIRDKTVTVTAVHRSTGGGGGHVERPMYTGSAISSGGHHAIGRAMAQGSHGDWGVKRGGRTLVGELGTETIGL